MWMEAAGMAAREDTRAVLVPQITAAGGLALPLFLWMLFGETLEDSRNVEAEVFPLQRTLKT